jgi:hypothetical protein
VGDPGAQGPEGPSGPPGPDGARIFQAETNLSPIVTTGTNASDPTAADGLARFGAASAAAGGTLYAVDTASAEQKLAARFTHVVFRLKVTNNSSNALIAVAKCESRRAGGADFTMLDSKSLVPAMFEQGNSWGYVTLLCDFRSDDQDQRFGVNDFVTGITDLWIDDVQLVPHVPCDAEMIPVGDGRCIDRRARLESAYGSSFDTCASERKRVCTYPELYLAGKRGIIDNPSASLRYAEIMYWPPDGRHYLAAGGGGYTLMQPSGTPLHPSIGAQGGAVSFRCCR